MRTQLFWALSSFLISSVTFAADGTMSGIHHLYQSPRALGMGDAFVAVANDYSSIFYNPAGLSRREDGQINLSLDLAGTPAIAGFFSDLEKLGNTAGTQQDKFLAFSNFLTAKYGSTYSARFGMLEGIWARHGFGIGVLPMNTTIDLAIHNQGTPALDIRTYVDTVVAVAHAQEFKGVPGRLSWGVTGKFVNRGFFNKQFNSLDLATDSNVTNSTDLREGYTVDADLGFLYNPDLPSGGPLYFLHYAKPTFGLVVRNMLDGGFSNSLKLLNKEKTEAPEKLNRVIDLGSRWEYPSMFIFSGRGTLDFRDILHPNFNLRKSFHVGMEFDWSVTNWWRGQYRVGLNQGLWTAGLSMLLTTFRVDLATWGEDFGTVDEQKENRMWMAKFNIDL